MTSEPAPFLRSIQLQGLLSFGPESPAIPLTPLNVLIGSNASGKSNFIEAFELLRATRTDLAEVIRTGGGASEWIWKGEHGVARSSSARLTAVLGPRSHSNALRYRLEFADARNRLDIVDEALEEATPSDEEGEVHFYYRFQRGRPVITTPARTTINKPIRSVVRDIPRGTLDPQQSVFAQMRDPVLYPELTRVGDAFGRILSFREWSFGRTALLREAQPADLPTDSLLPDLRNLGLVLNGIEHSDRWAELNAHVRRFLPRFQRLSTRIQPGGHVQINLHEKGLRSPVPASRLSDGTIRFVGLLAILLRPEPAPLICLEEPELGLHPDAIGLVAELLVEAAARVQIVVTTHSDVLVSALTEQTGSVLVCESSATGTALRRLNSDALRFWLDKYRLGEVWRMGELGGNP